MPWRPLITQRLPGMQHVPWQKSCAAGQQVYCVHCPSQHVSSAHLSCPPGHTTLH